MRRTCCRPTTCGSAAHASESSASITPHQDPKTGRITAIASLKLQKSVEPLPIDTTTIVQSRSAVGLKYLELDKGTSTQTLKAGQTIPVSQSRAPVEIDELFNMFDSQDADREPAGT